MDLYAFKPLYNYHNLYKVFYTLDVFVKITSVAFPITARPTEVSANLDQRHALLSVEGGSEADGWCLGFCTAIIFCALCRLRAGTPSVTCGDSSLHLREPRLVLISRL